ncbi:hypothetical protein CERZMDRAFT_96298 [Cercospora zeae-maydis SCOH1-5]|uniref:Mtf2-like C-terminal domain-containing protein n=1 Tax=Cercospora zeae-maydis SCOH1-5 TaxID=717836 RepID=A0A6A6FJ82_9PEZI|nr:hypothetical protein CERZMDRAFT_96298 [Cercospora zeae-maydis SCOH1-5]
MLGTRASHRRIIADCTHSTLLPFLYRTKTIARAYSDELYLDQKAGEGPDEARKLREIKDRWSKRPTATSHDDQGSRTKSREEKNEATAQRMQTPAPRLKKTQSIPFEGDTGSATPSERLQNSTMTPREMQIFEELFRRGIENKKAEEQAQGRAQNASRTRAAVKFPDLLKPLAEEAKQLRLQSASGKSGTDAMKRRPSSLAEMQIKDAQAIAIRELMDKAATDIECWEVLREHVLNRLRDAPDHSAIPKNFPDLPALLLHYMKLQTEKLPATHSLGLVALPELKKMGSLAFALGATTELYNQHMRLLWLQYRDLNGINDILAEMDREVFPFDEGTLDLITTILDHADDALRGKLGPTVRALWTMDRKTRGLAKMSEWKRAVETAVREQALRDAQELPPDYHHDDDERVESNSEQTAKSAAA